MRARSLKIVRSAAGASLLASGLGVAGVLGIGAVTPGIASAAGPAVSGSYSCAAPVVGLVTIPVTIQDLNTAPATLANGTSYVVHPRLTATIPGTLIKVAKEEKLTKITITSASMTIDGTNFAPGKQSDPATNAPVVVPVNTTTVHHGYAATLTFAPTSFTVSTTTGTATLTAGQLTMKVIGLPLSCFPPSQKITYTTPTTKTNYKVSGSNTLSPIVSIKAATATTPSPGPGRSRPTAGSSPSATPPSTARWAASPSTRRSSAWRRRPPTAKGYWEVASDGGLFAFGDAQFYGSMGGKPLNEPIVGIAATPTGGGYWEVASDGGIFAFGNAQFYGSMGGKPLNAPIVGMAATPTGRGYWEVASDGGLFAFGDAQFYGSMGGQPLNAPIVGIAATPTGGGYWEVASDGGHLRLRRRPVLRLDGRQAPQRADRRHHRRHALTGTGGYWEVASDGGLFAFGAPRSTARGWPAPEHAHRRHGGDVGVERSLFEEAGNRWFPASSRQGPTIHRGPNQEVVDHARV